MGDNMGDNMVLYPEFDEYKSAISRWISSNVSSNVSSDDSVVCEKIFYYAWQYAKKSAGDMMLLFGTELFVPEHSEDYEDYQETYKKVFDKIYDIVFPHIPTILAMDKNQIMYSAYNEIIKLSKIIVCKAIGEVIGETIPKEMDIM